MNLLVTASASPFAQVLLPRLLTESDIGLVVGIDREPADFEHERFVQVLLDPRSAQLARVLRGLDAVVHLAPALADDDPASSMVGSQNLCTLAHAAGARHLIHLSSALVYDTRTSPRTTPLDEQQARGVPADCAPLEALRGIEDWLDSFERSHPELRVARLRPHWVVGPHSFSLLARLLRGRLTPRLAEPLPQLQCVHEQDLAEAVVQALRSSARGAFNLAGDEAATLNDLHRQRRWLRLRATPARVARRLDTDGGCMELLKQPLVLDTRRARDELGWRPRRAGMAEILAGM